MAKENVKKFLEELSTNKELQEKFMAAQKGYEAEGKGEEEIFEDIVLPIAKEAGFEFTDSEYRAIQRDVMAEKGISEEELENVSGGEVIWCFVLGYGDDKAVTACFDHGVSPSTDEHGGFGVSSCYYIGVGVGLMGDK